MAKDCPPCWPENCKKTKTREAVWSELVAADKPLSALALLSLVQRDTPDFWLSTVYRVLETFVGGGCVVRSVPSDGSQAVYEIRRHSHRHYAVCLGCHALLPVDGCPLEDSLSAVTPQNFHVEGHSLEIYGLCGECFRKQNHP